MRRIECRDRRGRGLGSGAIGKRRRCARHNRCDGRWSRIRPRRLANTRTPGVWSSTGKKPGLRWTPQPRILRLSRSPPSREGDSPVLPDLLDQIPGDEDIGTVTADGAYGTRRCHGAIIAIGGTAIIPIRRNGRTWEEGRPAAKARNETLRGMRHDGRAFLKRWAGYHV